MVASRLWFDTEKVAPLLALRWRVTTMVYAKYFPSNNDCTSIAFYRPHDGKVSTSPFHNQIICPTNDAVVMYYNGRSHYNYCKRRADAPHSSTTITIQKNQRNHPIRE
jgi:hypothetical protein